MRLIFLLSTFLLFQSTTLSAQLPKACASGFTPAVTCADACIFCNFDGYTGSTIGFPAVQVPKFCGTGTIENVQWLGFIAGSSGATFTIMPTACFNGDGVQVALYSDCEADPIACNMGKEGGASTPVSITAALTPGYTYFLLIDGFAGDQCDFTIDVSPKEAVFEPPLGMVGAISGPTALCPGATATYSVAAVPGAGAYRWDGPAGAKIDTLDLPVVLLASKGQKVNITFGDQVGQICVQALNACRENPLCASSLPIKMLDDLYKPVIQGDTTGYLSCTNTPVALDFEVTPPGIYRYLWSADSIGKIIGDTTLPRPRIEQEGVYQLTVTNPETGCFSKKSIRIRPPDVPSGMEAKVKHVSCFGEKDGAIEVVAVKGGQKPLLFAFDKLPLSDVQRYATLSARAHNLQIQTVDGCLFDTTIVITEPAQLLVNLGEDTTIQLGDAIVLWDSTKISDPSRAAKLIAQPDTLSNRLCSTCMLQPRHSFIYAVMAIDSNGCKAKDEKTVTVSKYRRFYIPNIFSPESKNGNERLYVQGGDDVSNIQRFSVFNRWGNLVYETNNMSPGDAAFGWDGTTNGRKAEPGVFICRAELLFLDGEKEVHETSVMLIR